MHCIAQLGRHAYLNWNKSLVVVSNKYNFDYGSHAGVLMCPLQHTPMLNDTLIMCPYGVAFYVLFTDWCQRNTAHIQR